MRRTSDDSKRQRRQTREKKSDHSQYAVKRALYAESDIVQQLHWSFTIDHNCHNPHFNPVDKTASVT